MSPYLQALAKVSEEEFTLEEGSTVQSLLTKLSEVHGRELYELLFDDKWKELRSGVLVVLNDRIVQSVNERVKDGDVIVITIAYEGG
ncbi:MAG: MoaD/ThiS family protein [Thermofilaceae archaeon]